MFTISFLVEDNQLAPILHALEGKQFLDFMMKSHGQVSHTVKKSRTKAKPVKPKAKAKSVNAKAKAKPVKIKAKAKGRHHTGKGVVNSIRAFLNESGITKVTAADVVKVASTFGYSSQSAYNAITVFVKEKYLKRVGKAQYEIQR